MAVNTLHVICMLVCLPLMLAVPFGEADAGYGEVSNSDFLPTSFDEDNAKGMLGPGGLGADDWRLWSAENGDKADDVTDSADLAEKRGWEKEFFSTRGKRFRFPYYIPAKYQRPNRRTRWRFRPSGFVANRGKRLYPGTPTQYDDLYKLARIWSAANNDANDIPEVAKRRLGFTALRGKRSTTI